MQHAIPCMQYIMVHTNGLIAVSALDNGYLKFIQIGKKLYFSCKKYDKSMQSVRTHAVHGLQRSVSASACDALTPAPGAV